MGTRSTSTERCAKVWLGLALVLASVLGGACAKPEPVLLGFVGPLVGRGADLGISGRDGALLAVEQWNRRGGVRGRPVRLLARDDGQDPEVALRVDRELLDQGVIAILGHMTSTMSVAAVPQMNERRVVMMSPTSTTPLLSGRDDYFFRVAATNDEYAVTLARHLRRGPGFTRVAVVYDLGNRAYTEPWIAAFRAELEADGGRVVAEEVFVSGAEVPLADVALRASAPGIDGIVLVAGALDTAMLCQHVRKLGRQVPIAAAEWAATERLIELGGAAVEGIQLSQFFDRESPSPAYVAFRDEYRQRFGAEPGFSSVAAYDAAQAVLTALAESQRGEPLKAALLRLRSFPGLQGEVGFDAFGDTRRRTFVATVQDGRFRVVGDR